MGLSFSEYGYIEILTALEQKSLVRFAPLQKIWLVGIRMKHPVRLAPFYNAGDRKDITKRDRKAAYDRLQKEGNLCALCGKIITSEDTTHVDHIIPVSIGGTNEPSNLQVVHKKCNLAKGAGGYHFKAIDSLTR